MKLNKILVPLDGSSVAESALPMALDIARDYGASLTLLRVTDAVPVHGCEPVTAQPDLVREAEAYLEEIRRRLDVDGIKGISTTVWYGASATAIVTVAQQHSIDLIVMTTHGRTGLQHEMFGSVAEAVLRGTRLPILVVHPESSAFEHPFGPAAPATVHSSSA